MFGIKLSSNNDIISHSIFADAYRLFDKKEYSACIVSAYSSLEYQLSMHSYDSQNYYYDIKHQILNASQYLNNNYNKGKDNQRTINIIGLRNKIVHQKYIATKKEASDFLSSVEVIYKNIYKE